MASLPESWGLKARRRQSDGRAEVVGTNAAGKEYVARTCDGADLTDRDLKILDVGSPDKRDKDAFIKFYRDERDNARKNWEHSLDQEYAQAADKVVHAGLHLRESTAGSTRSFREAWERLERKGYI